MVQKYLYMVSLLTSPHVKKHAYIEEDELCRSDYIPGKYSRAKKSVIVVSSVYAGSRNCVN